METQSERRRVGSITYFDFKCPGCGAEGELGIDTKEKGKGQVGCPEDCGARFILWRVGDVWKLTCVARPVFEEDLRAMGLVFVGGSKGFRFPVFRAALRRGGTICPACKAPLLEDEDQTATPYHVSCQYSELDA